MFQYIDSSIQQMTEALEDILLQMDSKLTKFAEDKQVSWKILQAKDILPE